MTDNLAKPMRDPRRTKDQELAHDCRDTYGESNKGSRKTVPRRKAQAVRKERRAVRQATNQAVGDDLDQDALDAVTDKVRLVPSEKHTVANDTPLGLVLNRKESGHNPGFHRFKDPAIEGVGDGVPGFVPRRVLERDPTA